MFSGRLADRYGRRNFMLFNTIICFIGSIITTCSFGYIILILGRFIMGISSGISTSICSIYLNEISPINLRGIIGTTIQLTITFGIAISELFGLIWILNNWLWRIGCIIPAILSIIQLIIGYLTLPQSPQWLANNGNLDSSIRILSILRGTNKTINTELEDYIPPKTNLNQINNENEIKNDNQIPLFANDKIEINEQKTNKLFNFDSNLTIFEAIKKYPLIKKVLLISLFIHSLQQLCGHVVVFYYSTYILESIGVNNASVGSVLVAFVNFFSVILSSFFIDRKGRRFLLLLSCLGMAIASFLLTIMFIEVEIEDSGKKNVKIHIFCALATICLALYVIAFEFGLGPITWLYVAEISPIEYRASITSLSQMLNYGLNTFIVLISASLVESLGAYGFLPFGFICLAGFGILYKFIPETKQKTVEEILSQL